ncbi:hypothetical protein KC19_12G089100, partial [Ceratodon purpureus]
MPKRSRRDKEGGVDDERETVESVDGRRRRPESARSGSGRKGRKRVREEEGPAALSESKRKSLPGDSPHRRQKLVSAIHTPLGATSTRSRARNVSETAAHTPKKRHKSNALVEQFDAATKEDSDQLNLEINSLSHNIRLVITSPAKKKRGLKKTRSGAAD